MRLKGLQKAFQRTYQGLLLFCSVLFCRGWSVVCLCESVCCPVVCCLLCVLFHPIAIPSISISVYGAPWVAWRHDAAIRGEEEEEEEEEEGNPLDFVLKAF